MNGTIDDETALCLLVTWWMNFKLTDHPLPADIAVRGARRLKAQWQERGFKPVNAIRAGLTYAALVWSGMAEHDRIKWMGKLIEVCDGD